MERYLITQLTVNIQLQYDVIMTSYLNYVIEMTPHFSPHAR